MAKNIVIVHGWSDKAQSFKKLGSFLGEQFNTTPHVINVADWLSMDDDVTFADIALAMDRAWKNAGLPGEPRSVDVVVHSTGALVVRDWMTTFHTPESVPIRRFLMLAPANFGSQLAHKGNSFIGRVYKGWKSGLQTGRKILHGLEVGSPYTWDLAQKDLFTAPARRWYGQDRILATVLVGNKGYTGISSIANEPGGDGVVRISTANLNTLQLELTFAQGNPTPEAKVRTSNGAIAFGVIDKENHSTIVMKDHGPSSPHTGELIVQALKVEDADYAPDGGGKFPWQQSIEAVAPPLADGNAGMQNTVVHLHDDLGQDITDYFFEFYRKLKGADARFEQRFYKEVLGGRVHPYEPNQAYRALYLDIDAFQKIVTEYEVDPLYLSVAASPEYKPPRQLVGYKSFGEGDLGCYAVSARHMPKFFSPHRTVLIRINIPRWVDERVFNFPKN